MFSAATWLWEAYVDTDYIARGGTLIVGIRRASIDRLLGRHHARTAVFVTACNPRSRPCASCVNARRHRRLRADIRALGLRAVPGIGVGRSGTWPGEISLLVFGVSRRRAARLGRAWGQNAVVFAARGRDVEIVPLR